MKSLSFLVLSIIVSLNSWAQGLSQGLMLHEDPDALTQMILEYAEQNKYTFENPQIAAQYLALAVGMLQQVEDIPFSMEAAEPFEDLALDQIPKLEAELDRQRYAQMMADVHWDTAQSNQHFNEALIAALILYRNNDSLEYKRPIIDYLSKLAARYDQEMEIEAIEGNALTRTSRNFRNLSVTFFGGLMLLEFGLAIKNLPQRAGQGLVRQGALRSGDILKMVLKSKRHTGMYVLGGLTASGAIGLIQERLSPTSSFGKMKRMNPRPIYECILRKEVLNVGRAACDLSRRLSTDSSEDDIDTIKEEIKHLGSYHGYLQFLTPQYEVTTDAMCEEIDSETQEELFSILDGADIVHDVHPVSTAECNGTRINHSLTESYLKDAGYVIRRLELQQESAETEGNENESPPQNEPGTSPNDL